MARQLLYYGTRVTTTQQTMIINQSITSSYYQY